MVSKTLASSEVGHLINQWYGYIRSFSIPDSEYLKKEIENKLDQMEEDQDLLLYYSLMEFRHRLMLESLEPLEKLRIDQQPNLSDLLSEIENNQSRIKGMLDYYFNFFKGQFEFSRKNYIQAIQYYKRAELKLDLIPEEEKIEKAEFHYKVAAAYYRIKQNMFSLHHAEIALNMFEANKLYSTSTISCEMMLGANKLDLLRFDEAEAHYTNAMKFAELTKDNYSRGLACHNIGLSYALQNKSDLAEEYFRKVLEIPEYYETERGLRTDFELTFVLYKNENKVELTLEGFQFTKLAPSVSFKKSFTGFGNEDIVAATFKLHIKNNQGDTLPLGQFSSFLDTDKRHYLNQGSLEYDSGDLRPGQSGTKYLVFLMKKSELNENPKFKLRIRHIEGNSGDALNDREVDFNLVR